MCVGCMWSWGKETKWVRSDVHTGALLFPVGCCLPAASILSLHLFFPLFPTLCDEIFSPKLRRHRCLRRGGASVFFGRNETCLRATWSGVRLVIFLPSFFFFLLLRLSFEFKLFTLIIYVLPLVVIFFSGSFLGACANYTPQSTRPTK